MCLGSDSMARAPDHHNLSALPHQMQTNHCAADHRKRHLLAELQKSVNGRLNAITLAHTRSSARLVAQRPASSLRPRACILGALPLLHHIDCVRYLINLRNSFSLSAATVQHLQTTNSNSHAPAIKSYSAHE